MPTERCSLPAFSFLDGLQNLILIAAVIDNAKNNDILFLLQFIRKGGGGVGIYQLIGDIVISNAINDSKNVINNDFDFKLENMVGFENHGGRTYHNHDPLGYVKVGFGNNGEDKEEGMVYKNFIGSYLHGPFLPKNPHIADYMIFNALNRKYSIDEIDDLNDSIEINAHDRMLKRLLGE